MQILLALILMGNWCGSGSADTADDDNRDATGSRDLVLKGHSAVPYAAH